MPRRARELCVIALIGLACGTSRVSGPDAGAGGAQPVTSGAAGVSALTGGTSGTGGGGDAAAGLNTGGNTGGASAGTAGAPTVDPWLENWPQPGGPAGTFRVAGSAPEKFSAARGENIVWRAELPGGGQSGIAVWNDRLFLTTFEPHEAASPTTSATILGHALDATNGKILWSVKLVGSRASQMMSAYSDSTSWTPVTDGEHVWFFNASGEMGCWTMAGQEVWRRSFVPSTPQEPFNKQHQPFLVGDTIVSVEPLTSADAAYDAAKADWNYLRGIDKLTGDTVWTSEDALTHYSTPVSGRLRGGAPVVLHGRGAPHNAPERPVGLSLTSLEPGSLGKSLWRFTPDRPDGSPPVDDGSTFESLYTATWDDDYAYAFRNAPAESHLVLDIETGQLVASHPLGENVDVRQWDPATKGYVTRLNVSIRDVPDSASYALGSGEALHVHPNWEGNLVVNGYHYFSTMTNNRRNGHAPAGHSGPAHCLGRVNVKTGKVELLEVPVGVSRAANQADELIYGQDVSTAVEDINGLNLADDPRSNTDGWQIPAFFSTPVAVGNTLYMNGVVGIVYVIDASAPVFDASALRSVSDLGPLGTTWSMSSMSYSRGKLYQRTSKEVLCIGQPL